MKIISIAGACPQSIKCAPYSHELKKEHKEVLVHNGQHYNHNMSDILFEEFAKAIFEIQDNNANLTPIKTRALGSKAKRPSVLGACECQDESLGLGCLDGKMGAGDFLMRGDILNQQGKRGDNN